MPKINIDIVARTAKLERGIARTNKALKRMGRRGQATGAIFKKALGALAAYASIRGLGAVIKSSLQAIDVTAKLADRIGETTENIIRLQHAAVITGAGASKLAAGMDVLQKRLGEASFGMGEGKAALDLLGLSVEDLLKQSPAEQFKIIAEATSQLSSKAQQAAVTAKLFSRANQDLVNTLALGRAGLEALGDEAEQLGLTFSRVDAAKVEAANDALARAKASATGLANTLTIALAPAIETAAAAWARWLSSGGVTVLVKESQAEVAKLADELATLNDEGNIFTGLFTPAINIARAARAQEATLADLVKLEKALAKAHADGNVTAATFVSTLSQLLDIRLKTLGASEARGTRVSTPTFGLPDTTQLAAATDRLIASLQTQEEAIATSFQTRTALLEESIAEGIITTEEFLQAEFRLTTQHELATTAVKRRELKTRAALVAGNVATIAGALEALTGINANESRKQFRTNKAFAVASAIADTAAGVMKGFATLPTPAAWANAALLTAFGAARIADINATTFGGGGSVGGGSAAGAVAATPAAPPPQSIEVVFSGQGVIGPNQAVAMIEAINELAGDGFEVKATVLVG